MNKDTVCWILNQIQHDDLCIFDVEKLANKIDEIAKSIAEELSSRDAKIKELENQIAKMKSYYNCITPVSHPTFSGKLCNASYICPCDKWKLRESNDR